MSVEQTGPCTLCNARAFNVVVREGASVWFRDAVAHFICDACWLAGFQTARENRERHDGVAVTNLAYADIERVVLAMIALKREADLQSANATLPPGENMADEKKTIVLLKFGGKACGACVAMDKANTLERLVEAFPQIELRKYDVTDEEGDAPEGSVFEKNYKLSDEYGVEYLPTMVFEDKETGDELARAEGPQSFGALKSVAKEAIEELEATVERRALAKRAAAAKG